MNTSLYRIVFNKARGCMMAVSELASSNAKGKDKSCSAGGSGSRSSRHQATGDDEAGTFGFSKPALKAINSLVLLAMMVPTLTAPMGAYAQVRSDPNAPGNQRPTILNSANGLPQVNIQTPNANGVSRNVYSQFDVDNRGVIINNSRINAQTQQGGLVQGNPWLAQGSARIIVNEVNSNNPSYLNGYIEIAGQRAEIIIANPAGISVNGAGFINASSATLTTGTPIINGGNLEGYAVQKGTISINGYGLDASLTDYTGILARAVDVNAGIWANNLQIVTGANQINADQNISTPIAGIGGAPAFALDVSSLGGMYAGKISLIGTEAGLGVRNAGFLGASGDLSINSEGMLVNTGAINSSANANVAVKGTVDNSGSISAKGNATLDSKTDILNSGSISAGGNLGLSSSNTIKNTGDLTAEGNVALVGANGISNSGQIYASGNTSLKTGGDIVNHGMVAALGNTSLSSTATNGTITNSKTSLIAAGMTADGQMLTTGNLTLDAANAVTVQGQALAGNQLDIKSGSLDLSGTKITSGALALEAKSGDLNLTSANLSVARDLDLKAAQTLKTDVATISGNALSIEAAAWSNVQGQILQVGAQDTLIAVSGNINSTAGYIATNAQNLTIQSAGLDTSQGNVLHAGSGKLSIATGNLSLNNGQIASNGDAELLASQVAANKGVLISTGAIKLTVSGAADVSGGQISAGKTLNIDAASLNASQSQLTSQGALSIHTAGIVNVSQGQVASSETVTLTTGALNNNGGTIAGKSVDINTSQQTLDNADGVIASSSTLSINSGALNNNQGSIQSANAMVINTNGQTLTNTNGDATTGKGILSQSTLTISAGDLSNNAGYLAAVGATTINAQKLSNTIAGTIVSGDSLQIVATDDINNTQGQIQAAKLLSINTQGNLDSSQGLLVAGTQLDITVAKTLTTDSAVVSATSLGIQAKDWNNIKGQVIQSGATDTTIALSGSLNNTEGYIATNGQNLNIQATALNNNLGNILHAGTGLASITTGALGLTEGQIASNGDMTVLASQIDGKKGALVSKGGLALEVTGSADIAGGQLGAGKDLVLRAGSLDVSTGQVTAQGKLDVTVTGVVNSSQGLLAANLGVTLATGALNNDGGTVAGSVIDINTHAQSLSSVAGAIASSTTLTISSGALNNDKGSIQATGALTIDTNNQALTNTGGNTATGKGILSQSTLALTTGALDNTGGYIAAAGKTDITASSLRNDAFGAGATAVKGTIISSDALTITTQTGDLSNVNGQIQSAQKLALFVAGKLDNSQGLLASSKDVDIQAASILNANTKVGTTIQGIQGKNVSLKAGAIDNTEGGILAAETLTMQGTGTLNNTLGMLAAGGGANVISVGLNNSQGTIQSTNKLVLDAGIGDLNNTQGLIASSADVDIKAGNIINANTKVETLPNQLDIKGIQGKNVVLSAGAINNTDGGILASETLAIIGTGFLNNTKGMLAASETATIVATGVNNTQGTIQSAEKLFLNVGTGTINNSQGLIASSTEVAIQADTVSNRNTKTGTTIKGIQAKNVNMLANQVDNTEGGILAIDSLLIQGAGTVNNTNGILSSTGDLTVKDTSASPTANTASKTQQVINTGGAIVANKKLTIDSKGLSGDGAILNAGVTTNGVTTEGDISIKLLDSFNQSAQGSVQANGNLDLQTLGNLNNAGLIQSRQVLTAQAANINNQLGGEFSAGATQLAANGSITNRGLIDGSFTLLQANDISNTGTGRIYGDQVSILAGSLTNSAEGGKAAVIAARSRMDIGAYVISNADDALLLSLGDMAVGNTLDANGKATGQAEAFINSSATVEVMGSLSIAAKSLNNIDGYATSGSSSTSEDVVKYTIVSPGNPNDKQVFYGKDGTFKDWNNDPSNPEYAMFYSTQFSDLTNYLTAIGSSLEWIIERYTHTTETTGSYGTRPATISVGGSMTTNFVDGVNDKSKIIVGGALTGNGLNFQNTGSSGSFTDSEIVGTAQTTSVNQSCNLFGCSDTRIYSPEALRPGSVISNSWQNPAEILYNTVPTINGTVGARSDVVVVAAQPGVAAPTTVAGQAPVSATGAAGTGAVVANNAVAGGAAVGDVSTATSGATTGTVSTNNSVTKTNAPSSAGKVVRSLNNTTVTLPNNSLYILQPTSGNRSPKGYLVETDPRFTQNKLWLGSDYMLKQMGYDPATQTHRLGDGFYEQKLIREQVAQLTGRRFLDDNNGEQYANDEAQYQALMTAGIQFAKDYNLIPGVALTAEQMALLTTDIVWLVSKTVTLSDGSTTQVLVPQVYALVKPGDIDGSGNLLSAKSIDLKLKGDMVNSGLMAARGNLSIDAANIANLTGTIKGLDVSLLASQDIQSIQGNIIAGNALKIGAGNNVVIKAGNVAAGGNASITAGNDLLLIAQDTGRQVSINWGPLKKDKDGKDIPSEYENKDNSLSYGTYNQTGVNINVGGGLNMSAGNDLYAQGTQVNAGGGVSISAGRDASVTTALQGSSFEYNRTTTTRNGIFGKETRTITTRETDLTNTASNINAGGGANITAGRDLALQGTNINAAGINLSAGNNVNILAAYDIKEKTDINSLKSNFKGGSTTNIELDKKAMVSNLNANNGNGNGNGAVNITAGNTITLEGTLITGASFTPTAQKTNLLAAMDTKTTEHSKTSNNLVWQTTQSKGTTNQVMHLTNINVPVGMSNFQGAGGITVQLPKGASLTEQITSLAKQPGNEYLTDLAKRSDIDWQRVEVINKSWDYKKEGLTPAASIVVAIVVTIATAGAASSAGASLATSAGLTTTTAAGATVLTAGGAALAGATAAGITALATSATLAIINNKGDIGAALKELGSKENIKSLVTAMATAGLVQGLGAALNLPSTGLGSSFIDKLQTNLVNGIASSLITTAINGGSVEDALKNAVKGAVISSIAAQGANGIGDLTRDGKLDQTALENFANKFAHAVLGCATGAATANSQAGCAAGAVGAVAGGLGAELYDPKNIKGVEAQQFGKLTASLAVLLAGGDAKLVNVAGATAVNAIANNRQLHPKEIEWVSKNSKDFAVKLSKELGRNVTELEAMQWLTAAGESNVDLLLQTNNGMFIRGTSNTQEAQAYDLAKAYIASNTKTNAAFVDERGLNQSLFTATNGDFRKPEVYSEYRNDPNYREYYWNVMGVNLKGDQMSPQEAFTYAQRQVIVNEQKATQLLLLGATAGAGKIAVNISARNAARTQQFAIDEGLQQRITSVPKGQRPDPSSYLSQDYVDTHLTDFQSSGAVRFTSRTDVDKYGTIGPDGGFVFPRSQFDDLLRQSGGNLSLVESKLGLASGYLSSSDTMAVAIPPSEIRGLKIPSGNEQGANSLWIPGGYTRGGMPEAVMDFSNKPRYTVINLQKK